MACGWYGLSAAFKGLGVWTIGLEEWGENCRTVLISRIMPCAAAMGGFVVVGQMLVVHGQCSPCGTMLCV